MQPASGNVHDAHTHPEYDVNGSQTIYVTYSRSTPVPFSSEVRLVSDYTAGSEWTTLVQHRDDRNEIPITTSP